MTVFCWNDADAYISKLPETPDPFDWKEFCRDAFISGYEAAMKSGMQEILTQIDSITYAKSLDCE